MTPDVRAGSAVMGFGAALGLAGLFLPFHGVSGVDTLYGPLERLTLDPDPARSLWHVSGPLALVVGAILLAGLGLAVRTLKPARLPTGVPLAYMVGLVPVTAGVADRAFRSRFDGSYANADPADPALAGVGVGVFPLDAAVGAYFVLLGLVALLLGSAVLALVAERRRPGHRAPADG